MNDDLANFGGVAKLFPLPNLVLFPHVVQPLHVFEPRYRQLTADALAGDNLIAMALLRPGWEDTYEGQPALFPVACLGRIVASKQLEDGRYILLLRGVCRVRILDEVPSDALYRHARVEQLDDVAVMPVSEAMALRKRLAKMTLARFTGSDTDRKQIKELFEGETPLGALCDVLCFQLPLPVEQKQLLLEELDVSIRARALLSALEQATSISAEPRPDRKFPPEFSPN